MFKVNNQNTRTIADCYYLLKQYLVFNLLMYVWSFNEHQTLRGLSEAIAWKCSVKNGFLKISQNSQCQALLKKWLRNSGLRPATLLKKCLRHRGFPANFAKYLQRPSFTTPPPGLYLSGFLFRFQWLLASW